MPHRACISLGSNLGDRKALLDFAVDELGRAEGVTVRGVSSYHETPPIGGPEGQGPFLNAAAAVETTLEPESLLRLLQAIENEAGRARVVRWSERTLDLDLLLYDDRIIQSRDLVVPHPRMAFRRFVLAPLAEIAPDVIDPITGRTAASLLNNLDRRPSYVAFNGYFRRRYKVVGDLDSRVARKFQKLVVGPRLATPEEERRTHQGRVIHDLCEALPATPLRCESIVRLPKDASEYEDARWPFLASQSDRPFRDEALLAGLSPTACAEAAPGDHWLVSDFWYDNAGEPLSDRSSGRVLNPKAFLQFLECRSMVYPPTFVVSEIDPRFRHGGDNSPGSALGIHWAGFPGRDTPILIVDFWNPEAALRDILVTCEATRAG